MLCSTVIHIPWFNVSLFNVKEPEGRDCFRGSQIPHGTKNQCSELEAQHMKPETRRERKRVGAVAAVLTSTTISVWLSKVLSLPGRGTVDIRRRVMTPQIAPINQSKAPLLGLPFNRKFEFYWRKSLVKCYIWGVVLYGPKTSESRSEIPAKFWNVVLEKDWDQLERSCEKWRSFVYSQGRKEGPKHNKKEDV